MTMRPDVGEELRLLHKGKFLKDNQVLKDLGFGPTDFLAVVAKKKPVPAAAPAAAAAPAGSGQEADMNDDEAADLAAALAMSTPGYTAPEQPPAAGVVPSGQVSGEP